jgi:hypothetical protein
VQAHQLVFDTRRTPSGSIVYDLDDGQTYRFGRDADGNLNLFSD